MDLLTPSLPFIEALQRYGWLAGPMKLFSFLGSELFFLLLLPLVYWNINRRVGARLGLLLIGSVLLNDLIKVVFALPRPFWSKGVAQLASKPELSFGFPSGHAQNTAAIWTFLALHTKRPRPWIALAFALVVLVALSRLFVGAHYPLDVIGGAVLGYLLLGIFLFAEQPLLRWLGPTLPRRIGFLVASCVVLSLLYWLAARRLVAPTLIPNTPAFETYIGAVNGLNFANRVGALFGMGSGLILAFRIVPFAVEATLIQKIARFALGIGGLLALRAATSKLLPPNLFCAFLSYFLLTFWVTLIAPLIFTRLKLMQLEAREPIVM